MFYVNVSTAAGVTNRLVEGDQLIVGRSEDSDLVISHETLSRKHLTLTKQGPRILVEDLGSSNGSFVNGERLAKRTPTPLEPDDELTMGEADVRLTVTLASEVMVPKKTQRPNRQVDAAGPTRAMRIEPRPEPSPDSASLTAIDPILAEAMAEAERAGGFRPHWVSVGIGGGGALALVLIYNLLRPAPAPVPVAPPEGEPVASVPLVRRVATDAGYQMNYVESVQAGPNFAHKYLGDEFQRRLTRELVPVAIKAWNVDESRVVQALGITAELVKTLEDRRTSVGDTPTEKVEAMRRLEQDARAQLTDLLGSPTRVQSLMQMEKPLFER